MRVLFVGQIFDGSTAEARIAALENLKLDLHHINSTSYFPFGRRGWHSLWRRLCWGPSIWRLNAAILREAERFHPDIVWIEKGVWLRPSTLQGVRRLRSAPYLIHYSLDDQMNPANQSRYYRAGIPLYDLHVTTKSYNTVELGELGARRVWFMDNSYDPSRFFPRAAADGDREKLGAEVGFVGYFEAARAASIQYLAEHGVSVRVWGPAWRDGFALASRHLRIEGRPLWGSDYGAHLSSTDINLCFLSKTNRDLQTTRSVEIPASGAFMLAERTPEHLRLFEEGTEAAYFSSDDEMLEKVRYYLTHDDERRQIALGGRQRCVAGDYTYEGRFRSLINDVRRHRRAPLAVA